MLKDYSTIKPELLEVGDTILLSITQREDNKYLLKFGERIPNPTRAILMLNQDDPTYTPGIRKATLPAEEKDILIGLGINVQELEFELDEDFNSVVTLNYLNPTYKDTRLRIKITETVTPTRLEHILNPEDYAKRKGRRGEFILHKGEYIFSILEVVITDSDPTHCFLESDFNLYTQQYGKEVTKEDVERWRKLAIDNPNNEYLQKMLKHFGK